MDIKTRLKAAHNKSPFRSARPSAPMAYAPGH